MPGETSKRQWDSYTPHQQALWEALADSYYAHAGAYAHCRMPTPGRMLDMARLEAWQANAVQRWAYEANRDPNTRGLKRDDWPEALWQYCYERMLDAELLRA